MTKIMCGDLDDDLKEEEQHVNIISKVKNYTHFVYIDDDIEKPSFYKNLCNTLRYATEEDEIHYIINCNGGYVDTLIQLLYYNMTTRARTTAEIHRACSAASVFSLSCDSFVLHPFSHLMFHNISYGMFGKITEHENLLSFVKKENEKLLKEVLPGFLSDEEINDIVYNQKDLYLDYETIQKKLDKIYVDKKEALPKDELPKALKNKKIQGGKK